MVEADAMTHVKRKIYDFRAHNTFNVEVNASQLWRGGTYCEAQVNELYTLLPVEYNIELSQV